MRIVDLSVEFDPDLPIKPEAHRPKIAYYGHDQSWKGFEQYFPGVPKTVFPEGMAWANEQVTMSTHSGTHMDAPWHYHPTTDHRLVEGGRKSPTIEQVPLEYCLQPAVKLDMRKFADGYVVQPRDIEEELCRIKHTLKPLEIVLFNTSAPAAWGSPRYYSAGCGVGRDATLWLTERGVRMVGTDALGWDAPFDFVAERYRQTKDPSIIWEGHKAGREIGYYQMEKLWNLDLLPPDGFKVACFPIKLKGCSAAWTRPVALLED